MFVVRLKRPNEGFDFKAFALARNSPSCDCGPPSAK